MSRTVRSTPFLKVSTVTSDTKEWVDEYLTSWSRGRYTSEVCYVFRDGHLDTYSTTWTAKKWAKRQTSRAIRRHGKELLKEQAE
jgi:hypothetical protein